MDEEIHAAIDRVENELGPLDIMLYGAGIAEISRAEKHSRERWDRTLATNLSAAFLAAPASSYVTGVVLPVDGGWSCW